MFTHNPVPMAILDGPAQEFSQVNDAYLKLVARQRNELLHQPIRLAFPGLVQQGFTKLLHSVYRSGKSFRDPALQLRGFSSEQRETLSFDFACFPKHDASGKVVGVICQFMEVNQRTFRQAQLENNVKECTAEIEKLRQSLRIAERHMMRVQEEERRRLGIELHDRAGQLLAALKWKLSGLQKDIARECPDLSSAANDALELSSELAQELRTVSLFLYPPSLEKVGLDAAIRNYVQGLQERAGLTVDLKIGPHLPRLPQALEAVVFGVVQESLSNIYKHAQTKHASVHILSTNRILKLEVSDRGVGIPGFCSLDGRNFKIGVGIRGMQQRVLQLDGKFDIRSAANGTTVTAVLPIKENEIRQTSPLIRTARPRPQGNGDRVSRAA
jgi:signal transduction histidine kinase